MEREGKIQLSLCFLCAHFVRREFPGVMIGWWDNLEETRSPIKKKEADPEEVQEVREQWKFVLVCCCCYLHTI